MLAKGLHPHCVILKVLLKKNFFISFWFPTTKWNDPLFHPTVNMDHSTLSKILPHFQVGDASDVFHLAISIRKYFFIKLFSLNYYFPFLKYM
jgi:hypothetical protein